METALLEAKIETLKAKQESETRALLEEEVCCFIYAFVKISFKLNYCNCVLRILLST